MRRLAPRRALRTLVVSLATVCLVAVAPTAGAQGPAGVGRVAGDDRVATAIEVSRALFPCDGIGRCASSAVLVGAEASSDAFVAGPLAAAVGAPLLLVPSEGPTPEILAELARLDVESTTAVGGPAAIAQAGLDRLRVRGISVERVSGSDRYATSASVGARLPGDEVVLASGAEQHLSAAAAGGALAATLGAPLLLTGSEELPPSSVAVEITRRSPRRITLVGGQAVIARLQENRLASFADVVERVSGFDRIGTALRTAARARDHGATLEQVWVAGAAAPADQAVAAAAAGVGGGVLVLADRAPDGSLRGGLGDWFADRRRIIGEVNVVGGRLPVGDAVVVEIAAALVPPEGAGEIALSLELGRDRYAAGEPVDIEATVCNVGDRDIEASISGALRRLFVVNEFGDSVARDYDVYTDSFDDYRLPAGECDDLSATWDTGLAAIGGGVGDAFPDAPAGPGAFRVRLEWVNPGLPAHAPIYSDAFIIDQ